MEFSSKLREEENFNEEITIQRDMEASDVKRLRELEAENARLKRMYVDLSLDHELLKEIVEKNYERSETT